MGGMALLLSIVGIYALLSFMVTRRTREIGIRVALGARPGRIVAGIFSRAFLQISAGILAGSGLAALMGLGSTRQILLLLAADGIMLIVGLTACAVPVRRAPVAPSFTAPGDDLMCGKVARYDLAVGAARNRRRLLVAGAFVLADELADLSAPFGHVIDRRRDLAKRPCPIELPPQGEPVDEIQSAGAD